jgi:hypothetical protein
MTVPTFLRPRSLAVLCAFALGCTVTEPTGSLGGGGSTGPVTCALDTRYLSVAAAAKDGIPAVDDPRWVAPDHPTDVWYLSGPDRVVGFLVDGQAYAVPINILWYHEITNASIEHSGGTLDLAITHCPLTGTSIVFDRAAAGGAELGVSGILYQSNLVMYDRNTEESFWPQMFGEARCGPALGTVLPMYPSIEMRWDGWVGLYPDTRVLASPEGAGGPYNSNPYAGYDAPNAEFTFPMPPLDTRLSPKDRVFGVAMPGGLPWAFSFASLSERGPWAALERSFGGTASRAVMLWDGDRQAASAYLREVDGASLNFRADAVGIFDVETGSRWTVDGLAVEGSLAGKRLERVAFAYAGYWGAWQAFFPFTQIWGQRIGGPTT